MKNKNIKSILFSLILLMSVVSFIHVNMTETSGETKSFSERTTHDMENVSVKDSKMPDLKLVKSIINILGKFTTAK